MDFYGHIDGIPFRVQADKKPDKDTIAALHALVRAAHKIKITKPHTNGKDKRKGNI